MGKQTITCSVETCTHHGKGDVCKLGSIVVTPSTGCGCDVEKCEESMCCSFSPEI